MILKIQRFKETGQEYWILDDIRKISVGETNRITHEEYVRDGEDFDYDIIILDKFYGDATKHRDTDFTLYKVLICRGKDTSTEFSIVFDTIAYLCNDEGKTIEKIVP